MSEFATEYEQDDGGWTGSEGDFAGLGQEKFGPAADQEPDEFEDVR